MIRSTKAASAALLLLAASPGYSQQAAPVAVERSVGNAPLSADQRSKAIDAIIGAVREKFVFPDRVDAIVARLRDNTAAGRYDVADPGLFAARFTEDLRSASGDRHMYLDFDPAQYALASRATGGPERDQAMEAFWRRRAQRSNHGLAEMRILSGNIRYLKIAGFEWIDDETGAAYDGAMRFLRDADAIIIDLRGNGGGSHGAVRYLVSHFLEPDRLEMTFLKAGEAPSQSHALEYLPAGRLIGKPLYVLVDARTGSAAEAFAYDVQQFHVGRLIGTRTGGAANNNSFVPIAPAFMLSVSTGRPVHPVSQSNWEAVGIAPDLETSPAQALDEAYARALADLLAGSGGDPAARSDWAWARANVEARLKPVVVARSLLQRMAGSYGSNHLVFRQGSLWLERTDHEPGRLIPLDAQGLFTVEGYGDALRLRLIEPYMEISWISQPAPIRIRRSAAVPH